MTFDANDVAIHVATACDGLADFDNHGITKSTVRRRLVPPERRSVYVNRTAGWTDVWLVLRENTEHSAAGYVVVFDATRGWYGLCYDDGENRDLEFMGFYRDLQSVLEGM